MIRDQFSVDNHVGVRPARWSITFDAVSTIGIFSKVESSPIFLFHPQHANKYITAKRIMVLRVVSCCH